MRGRENRRGDAAGRELTSADPRSFKNVSFDLHRGEILGIGGLVGAQRTELIEAIFGLRRIASGELTVNGKTVSTIRLRMPYETDSPF